MKCYHHYFGTMMDNNNILRRPEMNFYGGTKTKDQTLSISFRNSLFLKFLFHLLVSINYKIY